MGIDFKRTLDAFTKPLSYTVDASGRIQGLSPADFFRQLNTFQTRLRTGIYSGITILADMFMVLSSTPLPLSRLIDVLIGISRIRCLGIQLVHRLHSFRLFYGQHWHCNVA